MKANKSQKWICLATIGRCSAVLLLAAGTHSLVVMPLHASPSTKSITDPGITAAIESDLRLTKSSTPELLGVSTSQGIVTLSGHSDNLLAKDRAVKVAESIRGVRSVVDRIEVTPVSRPDEDIRKDVLQALLQDPATESYQVAVSVQDAKATLTGSVGSWAESQLAAQIAKGIKGLKGVRNDLIINYADKRTDAEMTADARDRLLWDVWLAGDPISVKVNQGNMKLAGAVGSVLEKSRAFDDAWVNGVLTVDDSGLRVDPAVAMKTDRKVQASFKTDDQIKQAVLASFRYDPRLTGASPDVLVEDGAVILFGKVSHLKAKSAAEHDARNTSGVVAVDNRLVVDAFANLPSDADAEQALRAALAWDPLLGDAQIEAGVVGHIAYLSGTVDSGFEKMEAQDVASRVKGVKLVRNQLQVGADFVIWDYDGPYVTTETILPAPPKSDEQIKKDIEKAFFWSPFVHRNDIKVTVDGGVAVLSGKVGSWVGYEEASLDARKSGAPTIINRLKVANGARF
jgi:osmotically-inducible protein OsmY